MKPYGTKNPRRCTCSYCGPERKYSKSRIRGEVRIEFNRELYNYENYYEQDQQTEALKKIEEENE